MNDSAPEMGWGTVIARTLQVAVVAIVMLTIKEYTETHEFDIPAVSIDAAWVAGGAFLLYAVSKALSSQRPR